METMSKRTRVFNLLEGKPIDRTPAGFWLHFPEEMHHGPKAVEAHLQFSKQTDTDILKIMNENLMYDGETKVRRLSDIPKIRSYHKGDSLFEDQAKIIQSICDKAKSDYATVATIHGLTASIFHATGFAEHYTTMGYLFPMFCRERPIEMHGVLRMFTDSLLELIDCSLEAGADGIYYAALGGERQFFTDTEFAEFLLPYEKEIFSHIQGKTKLNILHICKANIDFARYSSLDPAIVNWSIYQNNVSLRQGVDLFPDSIILGGFQDRSGVLVDGEPTDILEHTRQILTEMKGQRFIVGADCTLPTEISYDRVSQVVQSIRAVQKC